MIKMEVYTVIGIWGGCLNEVSIHSTIGEARISRDARLSGYGLTDEDIPDNQHSPECRWNGENELHLHTVKMETFCLQGDGWDITVGEDTEKNPYVSIAIDREKEHQLIETNPSWKGKILKIHLSKERSHRETLVLAMVQEALTYSLGQVQTSIERRVMTQEFWHSLNRKGIIRNEEVSQLINLTLKGIK